MSDSLPVTEATPARKLPFSLGRQALAVVPAVAVGVIPTDVNDRVVEAFRNVRAGTFRTKPSCALDTYPPWS